MAERLYLGPVSRQLRGDHEDALTLEREARAKVGYLFDSMLSGQTFKSGSWSLEGGRRIVAFVWNDIIGKRAIVRLTGIGGEEDQILIEVHLESGLMFLGDNFTVDSEVRPRLWVSPRGTAPIDENGVTVVNTALPEGAVVEGSYISQQWTPTDNSMYTDDPVFDPLGDEYDGSYSCASMYTGLMRAAIEAKMGLETKDGTWAERYRYFEILPWGAGTPFVGSVQAYNSTGLVRTTDYTYFAVYITHLECKACRLVPTVGLEEVAANLVRMLRANVLSGENQDKVESVYLSVLTYATVDGGGPDEIELLDEEDITPVYDPVIGAAIAYGWHFSYPPLTEASIIRHAYTWADAGTYIGFKKVARAYLTTVSFVTERDEDGEWTISASATTSDEGAWTPNRSSVQLWVPKPLHWPWLNNEAKDTDWLATYSDSNAINSPVYCFYSKLDGLQLCSLKYERSEHRNTEDIHTPSLAARVAVCDAVSSIRTISPAPYVYDITAGVSVGTLDYTNMVTEGNAYQYDQSMIASGFSEQYLGEYGGSTENIRGKCEGGSGVIDQDGWLPKPFKVFLTVGSASYSYARSDVVPQHIPVPGETAKQPLGVALVIPRLNSEAVGLFVRAVPRHTETRSYSRSINGNFYNAGRYEFYENNTFETIAGVIDRYYGYSCGAKPYDYTNFLFTGSTTGAPAIIGSFGSFSNNITPGSTTSTFELTDEGFDIATLITSSQTIDLSTEGDRWYVYLSPDAWNTQDSMSFGAQESRLGNIIYPQNPVTGEWALKHNYSDEVETIPPIFGRCRWIGWE